MNVLAFIVAVVAMVLFAVEGARTRSLVAWGLAAVTLAWVLALCLTSTHGVHGTL